MLAGTASKPPGRRLAQTYWPDSLLQALRAGRQKIAAFSVSLQGSSFTRIRLQLNRLSPSERSCLIGSFAGQIAHPPARRSARSPSLLAPIWQDAARQRQLPEHGEAILLEAVGRDRFGRRHWLQPAASQALKRLRHAAHTGGIDLELVSSFRSCHDQMRIVQRKHQSGQTWEQILKVNAPPGYSEHHSGCAVDLAIPGEPVLTEGFEMSAAFAWLQQHAHEHGFRMSYPRGNPWGFIYEPWHWCYVGKHPNSR
jgi:LAS superfamily LD-carboxypeptidase LdcB